MNLQAPSGFYLPSPDTLFQGLKPRPAVTSHASLPATTPPPSAGPGASSLSLMPQTQGNSLTHLNLVGSVFGPQAPALPGMPAVSAVQPALPVSHQVLPLPPRQANALSGSQFLDSIKGLSGAAREQAFLDQILAGNVPDHLRHFKDIQVTAKGGDGQMHTATVRTLPDYLAIGSNQDYALVPMTPLTAQKIANQTGTSLPTRKLVNDIYKAAEVKLRPSPKPPGAIMMSTQYYAEHNATVRQQRESAGAQDGQLIAGHKKDVVLSNLLDQRSHRVAIYGWHQPNGKAIQPLSTVHEDTYADYSHGIRLLAGTVQVDGVERPIAEVLQDRNLAPLLSDEGAIHTPHVKLP